MAMSASMRLVWDRQAIRNLRTDPEVMLAVRQASKDMAGIARAFAPKRTGAGAASIQARDSRAAGAVDVAWDSQHHYMVFQEYGTYREDPDKGVEPGTFLWRAYRFYEYH
jgi:hypothetical protein